MKKRKLTRLLSAVLSLLLITVLLTGYAFADDRRLSSDIVSGSGTADNNSASESSDTITKVGTPISDATVTGIKNKVWTGKPIRQSPVVRVEGRKLKKGTDYTISYSNNKNVGTAKMKIKGSGRYSGSITRTFVINPKGTRIITASRNGSRMTVKWKKVSHQISGYKIAYNAHKRGGLNIRYADIAVVKNKNATSKTIRIGATYLRYRVWVRSYKKIGNKKYYSEWSDAVDLYRDGRVEWPY